MNLTTHRIHLSERLHSARGLGWDMPDHLPVPHACRDGLKADAAEGGSGKTPRSPHGRDWWGLAVTTLRRLGFAHS